ncbi:hypothetical protein [Psychroserpens mesophilus]|uniref:hypothetical protein n=1 Tax=Psychroserpens mesophilus TaxID=325473 RepID=UPI000AC56D28|nr:hypothetical protein [Psychroserpens mesophilus]
MKKSLLVLLSVLLTISMFSQNVFQNGSYTTNNQEEVNGLIKVVSESNIIYKQSDDAKETMFTSETIQGYTLNDPFRKFTSLSENNTPSAFYEYVIEGDISLLILNKVYYIHNQTNGLKKLEVKKIEQSTDQGVFESTINSYIGILSYYAKDCPSLQADVNSVVYRRNSLSEFVIKLNECNNNPINDYSEDPAINLLELGITAGGNYAAFEDARTSGYKTDGGDFGLSLSAYLSYSPNITKNKISFFLGVEYNQKKDEYTYEKSNFPGPRTVIHDASVIEPYIAAIYQPFYNKKGLFSPYIGIGSSYGFTLQHEVTIIDLFSEQRFDRELDQTFSILFKLGSFITISENKFLFEIVYSNYSYQIPGKVEDYGNNFQIKLGYVINLN